MMERRGRLGFSSLEVLLAIGLFALIITGLFGGALLSQEGAFIGGQRGRAVLLAEEGLEAARHIRGQQGFQALPAGSHGLTALADRWQLSGSSDLVGVFVRELSIRDLEPELKEVTATIRWPAGSNNPRSYSLSTELTNWTRATGNWARPVIAATHILDGGGQDVQKVRYFPDPGTGSSEQLVAMVRQSGSDNFVIVNVTSATAPFLVSKLSVAINPTDLSGPWEGRYVAVAASDNTAELSVVDLQSTGPASGPLEAGQQRVTGSYNAPGEADGRAVFVQLVSGRPTGYLVREASSQDEFVVVDLSDLTTPSKISSLDLGGTANDLIVLGATGYIASARNDAELQVVSLDEPDERSPQILKHLDLIGDADALSIVGYTVAGRTFLLVGRQNGELVMIDATDRLQPAVLASLRLGGQVNDLVLEPTHRYAFAITTAVAGEFFVIEIQNPAQPSAVAELNLDDVENGVSYNPVDDSVILVGSSNRDPLVIVTPP